MRTEQAPSTEQIRAAWDGIAAGFDEFVTPETMPTAEGILARVGLRAGMRLLDVAAGSGSLSIPAARAGADVVAVDLAPAMIERLRARARAEALDNLSARVMDGTALELDDDSFDVAVSVNGVSLFPDLPRGLAELARVVRPGGRVALAAFGALRKAEFIGFFTGALQAAVPGYEPLPSDPLPLPFQVSDPDLLHRRLGDAGLAGVDVTRLTAELHVDSAAHLWSIVTSSNPIGAGLVAGLSDAQRRDVLDVLDGMLRERSGGAPAATLCAELNLGTGTA